MTDRELLEQLLERLGQLERRVSSIESRFGLVPNVPASPTAAPPPPSLPSTPSPLALPPPPPVSLETRVGLGWMNRIGALTLVLGAAFFFKYAVDNDWIGPVVRVLIGLAAGLAGVAAGMVLRRRGHGTYAQGVAGAGAAVLYLTVYAAHTLYSLFGVGAAFALMTLVTAGAGYLSVRHQGFPLAALGMIGAYLTPVLLDTREYRPWSFFGYLLLVTAGWLWFARRQNWEWLEYLAVFATVTLGGGYGGKLEAGDRAAVTTFYAVGQLGVLGWSPALLVAAFAHLSLSLTLCNAWQDGFPFHAANVAALGFGVVVGIWRKWWWHSGVAFATASLAVLSLRTDEPVALVGWGALMFAAAWAMARVTQREALAPYLCGNGLILYGLGRAISEWAWKTRTHGEARSVEATGITVLLAVWGLGLLISGIAKRFRLNRVLGLGLLGLVVAKLYVYDVWQINRLFRILAFAGLGGLLLSASFLYSKYRGRIEALLKDDAAPSGEN
jgi:uncharacterized membrane protein